MEGGKKGGEGEGVARRIKEQLSLGEVRGGGGKVGQNCVVLSSLVVFQKESMGKTQHPTVCPLISSAPYV